MYLSLEPCNLKNNINSCTKQIIRHGIKKVVIGMLDPNPNTFRRGYTELKSNRIEVVFIKIQLDNFLINYSHYCTSNFNRPLISLKIASSLDGKITHAMNKKEWITSKLAREHVQQIRSFHNSILVGTNTMLIDNPTLNTRIQGYKKNNFRIVLDKNLKINLNSNLLKNLKKNPLIIYTSNKCDKKKYKELKKLGIEIKILAVDSKSLFSLEKILLDLKEKNINSVLIEGGAKTASSFLNKNYVDVMYLYKSNYFIGKGGLNMLDEVNTISKFELYNKFSIGEDQLEVWINKNIIKNKICLQE